MRHQGKNRPWCILAKNTAEYTWSTLYGVRAPCTVREAYAPPPPPPSCVDTPRLYSGNGARNYRGGGPGGGKRWRGGCEHDTQLCSPTFLPMYQLLETLKKRQRQDNIFSVDYSFSLRTAVFRDTLSDARMLKILITQNIAIFSFY